MKCKNCNENIIDDGRFKYCPYCGYEIKKQQELSGLRDVISYLIEEYSFDILKQSQRMASYVKDYLYFDERSVKLFKIATDAGVLRIIYDLSLDCSEESKIACMNKCVKILEDTCFLSEANSEYIVNEIIWAIYGDKDSMQASDKARMNQSDTSNKSADSSRINVTSHNNFDSKKIKRLAEISELDIDYFIKSGASVTDDVLSQIYNYSLSLIAFVNKLGDSPTNQNFFKFEQVDFSDEVKRRSFKESEQIAFNYLVFASKSGFNQATQALGFCFANGIGVYERDEDIAKMLYGQYKSKKDKPRKNIQKKKIEEPSSEYEIIRIIEQKDNIRSLYLTNSTIKIMYNYGIKLISMTVSNSLNYLISGPEIIVHKFAYNRSPEENQRIAVKILMFIANYGDSDSSLIVGDCFRYGYGVDIDHNAAIGYYRQAYIYGNKQGYERLRSMET